MRLTKNTGNSNGRWHCCPKLKYFHFSCPLQLPHTKEKGQSGQRQANKKIQIEFIIYHRTDKYRNITSIKEIFVNNTASLWHHYRHECFILQTVCFSMSSSCLLPESMWMQPYPCCDRTSSRLEFQSSVAGRQSPNNNAILLFWPQQRS